MNQTTVHSHHKPHQHRDRGGDDTAVIRLNLAIAQARKELSR
jgi:hypothetical protein